MPATIQTIQKPTKARALDTSTSEQIVGPQLITAVKDTDFSATPNWAAFDPDGGTSATADLDSARWKVTSTTDTDREGTEIALSNLGTLTAGAKYRITCDMQATTAGFTLTVGMGGESTTQAITTSNVTYNIDIVIVNTVGSLRFYTEESTARIFHMDNITVHKLESFGNNNHGQIYSGRALEFDGVADYLQIHTDGLDNSFGSWPKTFACWFYADVATSEGTIASGILNDWAIVSDDSVISTASTGDSDNVQTPAVIENKTWYRLVVVSNVDQTDASAIAAAYADTSAGYGPSNFSIYLNGQRQILEATLRNRVSERATIGAKYQSSAYEYFYSGKLSDVQVWDTAWTAEDALYDYNNPEQLALNRGGTSLTNSNLKLWYPMNDGHRGQQSYILDASNTGLGDNLVVNGGFAADTGSTLTTTTDWVLGTGWSITDGIASCDGTQNPSSSHLYQEQNKAFVSPDLISGVWKIVFTISNYSAGGINCSMGGWDFSPTFSENGTHEVYIKPTNTSSNNRVYITANATFVGSVDNVEVYKVNDKNHATTVFYGDELNTQANAVTPQYSSASEAADSANWTNSGMTNFGASGTGVTQGAKSLRMNVDGNGDYAHTNFTNTIVGRTYRFQWDWLINNHSSTNKIDFKIGTSADDDTNGSIVSYTVNTGTSQVTGTYKDFVATATTTFFTCREDGDGNDADLYLDNLSLREIGTATGWTDADQQLDIPQTALQSYNQLAWFDGVADYVSIADSAGFTFATGGTNDLNFSISTWINMNDATSFPVIGKFSSSHREYILTTDSSDKLYFKLYDNNESVYIIGLYDTALTSFEGQWMHVVATYNGSEHPNGINIYINGESKTLAVTDNASYVAMEDKDGVVAIGANLGDSNYANGAITEVSIFSSELTQAKVNELYNDGKALDAMTHSSIGTLEGYWRNNGLAIWQDETTNNRDGTPQSITETMLITAGADGSRDSQGFLMNRQKTTNSLNMPYQTGVSNHSFARIGSESGGTDDGLSFLTSGTGGGAMTITCWVKPQDAGNGTQQIVSKNNNTDGYRIQLNDSSKTVSFFLEKDDNHASVGCTSSTALANDTWYFIAASYDGAASSGESRIYIGTSSSLTYETKNTSGADMDTSAGDLFIGAHNPGGGNFIGEVDDVCIYNDEFTALESDGSAAEENDVITGGEVYRNYKAGKRSHR